MAKVSFSTKLKMTIFYEAENDNLLKQEIHHSILYLLFDLLRGQQFHKIIQLLFCN